MAIFKFYYRIGKYEIFGLFIESEDEVTKFLGNKVHILGYDIVLSDINVIRLSIDADYIEMFEQLVGGKWFGINPLDYIDLYE